MKYDLLEYCIYIMLCRDIYRGIFINVIFELFKGNVLL